MNKDSQNIFSSSSPFKSSAYLFGVLLILVIVILVSSLSRISRENNDQKYSFTVETLKSITLSGYTKNVTLEKNEDQWQVKEEDSSYPADTPAITELIEKINALEMRDAVSKNKEHHGKYEVTQEKATQLVFKDSEDNLVLHLYLGKPAPGYTGQYVRENEEDTVSVIKESLMRFTTVDTNMWKDKTIFRFNPNTAIKLALKNGEEKIVLEKTEDTWNLIEPQTLVAVTLDQEKIGEIVQQLSTFDTSTFADKTVTLDDAELNIDQEQKKIFVGLEGEKNLTLYIGKLVDGDINYYVRKDEAGKKNDIIFKVAKPKIDLFEVTLQDLEKQDEVTEPPE